MYKTPIIFTIIISILLIILLSGRFQWLIELKNKIKIIIDERKESYKKIKKEHIKNKKLV